MIANHTQQHVIKIFQALPLLILIQLRVGESLGLRLARLVKPFFME